MKLTRAELDRFVGATADDLVGDHLRLLFVGINPSLWSAATNSHFAHPGNRFLPALLEAEIITRPIERGRPMTDEDRAHLTERGVGITNIVQRATAKASDLGPAELVAGGERLRRFVRRHEPVVVAIAGITAFRTAFHEPRAAVGQQDADLAGAELWVVPNPSGLNAHETVASLAAAYRAAGAAAGIV